MYGTNEELVGNTGEGISWGFPVNFFLFSKGYEFDDVANVVDNCF